MNGAMGVFLIILGGIIIVAAIMGNVANSLAALTAPNLLKVGTTPSKSTATQQANFHKEYPNIPTIGRP